MKHFIFDLGGVINKRLDKNLMKDQIIAPQEKYKEKYMEKYLEMEKGLYDYEEFIHQVNGYLIYPDLEPKEYIKNYIENGIKFGGIYQETMDLIYKLKEKNYKVYLLSNLIPMNYEKLCKDIDISIFDGLFLSYELKLLKPDKKIYLEVIKRINDNPHNMFFFDDRLDNIEKARETGLNAFQVTGENIKEKFELLNVL